MDALDVVSMSELVDLGSRCAFLPLCDRLRAITLNQPLCSFSLWQCLCFQFHSFGKPIPSVEIGLERSPEQLLLSFCCEESCDRGEENGRKTLKQKLHCGVIAQDIIT